MLIQDEPVGTRLEYLSYRHYTKTAFAAVKINPVRKI